MLKKISKLWHCIRFYILHKNTEKYGLFISLIIGVLSLFTLASPILEDFIKGRYAELQASVVESSSSQLSLVVANYGNTTVVIKKAQIVYDESDGHAPSTPMPLIVGNPLIKPNEASIISTGNENLTTNVVDINLLEMKNPIITKYSTIDCTIRIEYVLPGYKPKIFDIKEQCFAACIQ